MSTSGTTVDGEMKRKREPSSPGEIPREELLAPLGVTQKELADHLGCDVKVINRIVNGRTSVSAEMALQKGAYGTTPDQAEVSLDSKSSAKIKPGGGQRQAAM